MFHPLGSDLSKMNLDELNQKHGDLLNRLTFAHRMGRGDMVNQLQLLLQDYQEEISNRNRKTLEDMEKNSKNFKNIIDIK